MKKWVGILLVLFFLAGCQEQAEKKVKIKGEVKISDNKVVLSGNSNLPKGAGLIVELKSIKDDSTLKKEKVPVKNNGKYQLALQPPSGELPYKLQVTFQASDQSEAIKKDYGDNGEYISQKSPGFTSLKEGEETINIIRLYNLIDMEHSMESTDATENHSSLSTQFEDHQD